METQLVYFWIFVITSILYNLKKILIKFENYNIYTI